MYIQKIEFALVHIEMQQYYYCNTIHLIKNTYQHIVHCNIQQLQWYWNISQHLRIVFNKLKESNYYTTTMTGPLVTGICSIISYMFLLNF